MAEQCDKGSWTFEWTSVLHNPEPNDNQEKTNKTDMNVIDFFCVKKEECCVRYCRSHDEHESKPVDVKPSILRT